LHGQNERIRISEERAFPDAAAFARAIYAELHQCDEAGAELIVVEAPPPGEEWRGIADRLARAAG
jgi:L-threonylcarbamoyladenylate synthase